MKELKNVTIIQSDAVFKNDEGEDINYKEYVIKAGNFDIYLKPRGTADKVHLADVFSKIEENKS